MTDFAALTLTLDSTSIKGGISELNRLGDAGDKAERNISRSTGIIKDSFDSIKNAAIGVVSAYGALSTIKGLANAAIDVEKFESALKVATGSAKAANAELDFIRKTSNELGLSLRDTTDQYSKLAVAAKGTKLEGQAVREIFVGISQAATALKLRSDETSGALLAIQQIISKGTVSAEELRGQLGERLPGAFQIAARSIGVTTEELGKLLQKGELTAEVLLPNFARELQRTFGAESQAAAAGLQSQINRFNNALFELQVAIGRVGIIDFFTSATQSVSVFLSKSADIVKLYGNDVRIAFAAVIDVGRGVINTFHAAGLGIASIVAQVKALLQLDIKKAISID
ncbi:MAG TPA: tape measure protein, partial [Nitrosomonas sp.]|nr:tape measure protein [Nitrosomonas sp.]